MDSSSSEPPSHATRRFDCPQCGAPVVFQSSISLFAVCGHCRSMVVRKDFQVESFGLMAELPMDLSPLKIGTKGYWQGRSFSLIGRLRLHWRAGSWTEWCADFGDGTTGWIAEAQGFYMVSFEHSAPALTEKNHNFVAGQKLNLQNEEWLVTDVKTAKCIAVEGELPFVAPPGWERVGIDLTGPYGQFGSIEITEYQKRSFFVGEYAQFEDLNFSELRKVPGWDQDAEITRHQSTALNCPKCAAPVTLRAEGLSSVAVCGSCASVLDTTTPMLREVGHVAKTTLQINPRIPIGTRGLLQGDLWEAIGFMRRKDRWCQWEEYLLFNPWLGFRFLINFNNHWSMVKVLPGHYTDTTWNEKEHALYSREEVTTTDILGEFYWRARTGESALVIDHISPPYILTREVSKDYNDMTWSGGQYIDFKEVADAFQITLPAPHGMLLNMPNPHQQRWRQILPRFIFILLTYIIIQFACLGIAERKPIATANLAYTGGTAENSAGLSLSAAAEQLQHGKPHL
ncbi:MAG: DUF4178 domain-containing protein [Verrucomicrobia bacterium]|nr:DUF4178 domain-containing protein [Verrucomicrobiota bacterium]